VYYGARLLTAGSVLLEADLALAAEKLLLWYCTVLSLPCVLCVAKVVTHVTNLISLRGHSICDTVKLKTRAGMPSRGRDLSLLVSDPNEESATQTC